ncbi:MAG: hypothetical protein HY744_16945 [Deltaproteobacteria bacterium]|nr:hypothetical protein [Deltaproteobacteria bacterium]
MSGSSSPLLACLAGAALLLLPAVTLAGEPEAEPAPSPPAPGPEPGEGHDPPLYDVDVDPVGERAELPPGAALGEAPRWERHLELGGEVVWVSRPFVQGEAATAVRYDPFVGFGLHLRWELLRFLRFHPYLVDVHHDVRVPSGALATAAPGSVRPDATVSPSSASTYVFGARIEPTLWLSDRARAWVGAGVGWGRFEFPAVTVTEPGGAPFEVRSRSAVFVEFPISVGVAFDVVPRWLAVEYEIYGAPVVGQSGDALDPFQAVDAAGTMRELGPLGAIEASFVHALGLALIL